MKKTAVGLIELSSIAAGFAAADVLLKAAAVELLLNRTICSGKYLIILGGEVAAVEASLAAGVVAGGAAVIDSCLIPNVDPAVFPALSGTVILQAYGALGLVESFSVAALIEGADAAVKAASVQLLEIRMAMALGGKAFLKLSGEVAAVEAAVEAGAAHVARRGLLVNKVVIPNPSRELYGESV